MTCLFLCVHVRPCSWVCSCWRQPTNQLHPVARVLSRGASLSRLVFRTVGLFVLCDAVMSQSCSAPWNLLFGFCWEFCYFTLSCFAYVFLSRNFLLFCSVFPALAPHFATMGYNVNKPAVLVVCATIWNVSGVFFPQTRTRVQCVAWWSRWLLRDRYRPACDI